MSATVTTTGSDDPRLLDGRTPLRCEPALQPFASAGVLAAADVHVAAALCRLHGVTDPAVLLATALAARAPRVGHVCLDVDTIRDSIVEEATDRNRTADGGHDDITGLPWPAPQTWLDAVSASALVVGVDGVAPLVVEGHRIYLARYHGLERRVADTIRSRRSDPVADIDHQRLATTLDRLFPEAPPHDPQRRAAAAAVTGRLTIVAGGPGTGKTWTVARILAALADQAVAGNESMTVALAAPTGKAAARLDEGIREALEEMDLDADVRTAVQEVGRGQTLHGLIGIRPGRRAWHHAANPLPHDVVIVDEMSMASLSMAARLLDATRPEARVVLVGDPAQLASVEAGSVLGDIVAGSDALGDALVVLHRRHRFGEGSGIADLADAIRAGDAEAAIGALRAAPDLQWIPERTPSDLTGVRAAVVQRGREVTTAARAGDGAAALRAMERVAILCAHRRGPDGVAGWNHRVDQWLGEEVAGWQPWQRWQPGRAVIATANDRQLRVFNGDIGVVVATDAGPRVAFDWGGAAVSPVTPVRLEDADTVHAMTIHKSQGSQWDHVIAVLPDGPSRILTRELLYTAVTRAADRVTIIGDEATIRAAIARPIHRASGLRDRLSGVRSV